MLASSPRRSVEPRLSGEEAYTLCEPLSDPHRLIPKARCGAIKRVASKSIFSLPQQANRGGDGGESAPRLSRTADRATVEAAVRKLGKSSHSTPSDAGLLSDLAAGYLLRAEERDDPFDLVLGLEAADHAIAADPRLPEARFNRALLLEKLYLRIEAWRAWQDYLNLDDRSGWAEEARARAESDVQRPSQETDWEADKVRLQAASLQGDQKGVEEIVISEKQSAREYAEQQLMGLWAEAWRTGKVFEAERYLRTARAIGHALQRFGGDEMVAGSVAAVDSAISDRDQERLKLLADGYRAFSIGHPLYKRYETKRALELLTLAQAALAKAGSPLARRVAFFITCGEYHLDHFAKARAELDELWKENEDQPFPSLLGHITWMQGLTRLVQGNPIEARSFYERSLVFFQKVKEEENVLSLNSLVAEILDQLGRNREAWTYRYTALRSAHRLRDPQLIYLTFSTAAQSAFKQGRVAIALDYQDELLRRILSSKNHTLLADAWLVRGLLRERLGNRDRGLLDLARARQEVAAQTDAGIRRDLLADLAMIEGEVSVETDPGKAVGLFTSALQVYEENRQVLQSMMAHRARGHAHRKVGSLDLAAMDIEASLAIYEKLGENASGGTRLAFLARTKEIFDEAISFEALDRHRSETAFAYADLARTRVLPGAISNLHKGLNQGELLLAEGASLSPQEIRTSLPEGTVLVQYRALGDRVLMWVVQRDGIESFETPILLDHLLALIEHARSSPEETRELSQVLLSPWMPRIQPGERLVFALDEVLDAVPFSLLKEIRTDRYLLEGHEILITPSATLYIRALAKEKRKRSAPHSEPGLVLGNPSFDHTRFGLSDLPSAEAEARRIAGMYPGSQLLLKSAATRKSFLEGVQRFSWIHFAGHSVINRDQPLFSMLVLAPAPDGGDSGVLYGHEIYSLKLASTRLVVLSACDTGNESGSDEGSTSIARAFLAAGVPAVVASLWATDDRASAELFARFHERLRVGDDPAKALRFAQLSLLKSGIPSLQQPSKWGAFEVIGASVH